jgi:hypothetical protein
MTKEIDVGMKCVKYMLFVANFMFVVSTRRQMSKNWKQ